MHLKQHTDYALRILMYVARKRETQVSSREISDFYSISYSHTVKTVNKLGKLGYLELKRGRYGGGITLAMEPTRIEIGTVVRQFETNLDIVECFDETNNQCTLTGGCRLKSFFHEALNAFFDSLDGKTLADIVPSQKPAAKTI
ncbi:Rrf2 family transcriptional regulator [Pontiellaceae bacterium B1224]|nr:Rrf2 family transcriptional regulator [Pontiellaceae bacterium B1224]